MTKPLWTRFWKCISHIFQDVFLRYCHICISMNLFVFLQQSAVTVLHPWQNQMKANGQYEDDKTHMKAEHISEYKKNFDQRLTWPPPAQPWQIWQRGKNPNHINLVCLLLQSSCMSVAKPYCRCSTNIRSRSGKYCADQISRVFWSSYKQCTGDDNHYEQWIKASV